MGFRGIINSGIDLFNRGAETIRSVNNPTPVPNKNPSVKLSLDPAAAPKEHLEQISQIPKSPEDILREREFAIGNLIARQSSKGADVLTLSDEERYFISSKTGLSPDHPDALGLYLSKLSDDQLAEFQNKHQPPPEKQADPFDQRYDAITLEINKIKDILKFARGRDRKEAEKHLQNLYAARAKIQSTRREMLVNFEARKQLEVLANPNKSNLGQSNNNSGNGGIPLRKPQRQFPASFSRAA